MEQGFGLETRFHGPTNHRGSRISVRRTDHNPELHPESDRVVWFNWDHALNGSDNHAFAVQHWLGTVFPADEYDQEAVARCGSQRGEIFVVRVVKKRSE